MNSSCSCDLGLMSAVARLRLTRRKIVRQRNGTVGVVGCHSADLAEGRRARKLRKGAAL